MTEMVPRRRIQWPLLAIVGAAAGLIAVRMRWPRLLFDTTSLILFAIAAVAWALAFLPISKLKWGDFEAELEPLVAAFGQKVIAAEAAPSAARREGQPGVVYRGGAGPAEGTGDARPDAALREFQEIVGSAASNRDKLVRVGGLIDRVAGQGRFDAATIAAVDEMRDLQRLISQGSMPATADVTVAILDFAGRLLRTMTR